MSEHIKSALGTCIESFASVMFLSHNRPAVSLGKLWILHPLKVRWHLPTYQKAFQKRTSCSTSQSPIFECCVGFIEDEFSLMLMLFYLVATQVWVCIYIYIYIMYVCLGPAVVLAYFGENCFSTTRNYSGPYGGFFEKNAGLIWVGDVFSYVYHLLSVYLPIGSMYGIFTSIWLIFYSVHVGKYIPNTWIHMDYPPGN